MSDSLGPGEILLLIMVPFLLYQGFMILGLILVVLEEKREKRMREQGTPPSEKEEK